MNISEQLKNYRKEFNISQEDLAQIVHVSRQTISNWENSKSYPDLQSLVLLSEYFKISLDELVKGDVVRMKDEVERNKMYKYSIGMLIGWIFMILSIPVAKKIYPFGLIITAISIIILLVSAFKVEKIKKMKDIYTYKEILSYMENREIPIKESKYRNNFTTKLLYGVGSAIITALLIVIIMKFI